MYATAPLKLRFVLDFLWYLVLIVWSWFEMMCMQRKQVNSTIVFSFSFAHRDVTHLTAYL